MSFTPLATVVREDRAAVPSMLLRLSVRYKTAAVAEPDPYRSARLAALATTLREASDDALALAQGRCGVCQSDRRPAPYLCGSCGAPLCGPQCEQRCALDHHPAHYTRDGVLPDAPTITAAHAARGG